MKRILVCLALALSSIGGTTALPAHADYPWIPSCSANYVMVWPGVPVGARAGCTNNTNGHPGEPQHIRALVACNGSSSWRYSPWVYWTYGQYVSVNCLSGQTATNKAFQLAV